MKFYVVFHLREPKEKRKISIQRIHELLMAEGNFETTWQSPGSETFVFCKPKPVKPLTHEELAAEMRRLIKRIDPRQDTIEQFELIEAKI